MLNSGKCPKCEKVISNVKIEDVSASGDLGQTTWSALSYICPSCNTVLSVQIDPIAIMKNLLKDLG